jgi:peptide/nickel transport system permease protein
MGQYVVGRLAQSVVLLIFVSILTFGLIHVAPGGPAVLLAPGMSGAQIAEAQQSLGLNDPIPVQYVRWLGHLIHGDLGKSYSQGLDVTTLITKRLSVTLQLLFTALALSAIFGILIGVVSAMHRNSLIDHLATGFSFFGMSVPTFWLGLMLIILFSIKLHLLPSSGAQTLGQPATVTDRLEHLLMPAVVLAVANLAQIARYTRSSMIEVLQADYLRTARAKGLREQSVVWRHALRNAMIPVITVIALGIPRMVGGAAITESVFAWPGMGQLAVDSALQRDYPTIMGITMMVSVVVILTNFLTDLSYLLIDPRVKLSRG